MDDETMIMRDPEVDDLRHRVTRLERLCLLLSVCILLLSINQFYWVCQIDEVVDLLQALCQQLEALLQQAGAILTG